MGYLTHCKLGGFVLQSIQVSHKMHLTQTAPRRWPAVALLGVMLLLEGVVAGGQTNSPTLGTVVSWGIPMLPYVQPLTRFKAIAAGGAHNLALKPDGTVVAWGDNFYFNGAAIVPDGLSNVVAIAPGESHSLALRQDGTVVGWGAGGTNSGIFPDYGQSLTPAGLTGVVAISAGGYHSLALKRDGAVVAWGAGETNGGG